MITEPTETRTEEAQGILNYWLDIANGKDPLSDDEINHDGRLEAFGDLQNMLLMYNTFAEIQLDVEKNEVTGFYSLKELW